MCSCRLKYLMQTHSVTVTISGAAYTVIALAIAAHAQNMVPKAVEVSSGPDLIRAVDEGEEHILISKHLSAFRAAEDKVLLSLKPSTKSIQVLLPWFKHLPVLVGSCSPTPHSNPFASSTDQQLGMP